MAIEILLYEFSSHRGTLNSDAKFTFLSDHFVTCGDRKSDYLSLCLGHQGTTFFMHAQDTGDCAIPTLAGAPSRGYAYIVRPSLGTRVREAVSAEENTRTGGFRFFPLYFFRAVTFFSFYYDSKLSKGVI